MYVCIETFGIRLKTGPVFRKTQSLVKKIRIHDFPLVSAIISD